MSNARKNQLKTVVEDYFAGLEKSDFSLIPFSHAVTLYAPLAPRGHKSPFHGKEALRSNWWPPLENAIGRVKILNIYYTESLGEVIGEAEIEVKSTPPVVLKVADRFKVDSTGSIVEQVNYFDPRDLTTPGWDG